MTMNKEQIMKDFVKALEHIDEGEQIVSIYADEDNDFSVTMEPEIRSGKEYYTFGIQGHVDGEDLSDIGYLMLSKGFLAKALEEVGGPEELCEFAVGAFEEGVTEGKTKEGVPAE